MYEYRAFGEQLKRLDADGDDTDDAAKYSYGGKELDDGTNLYYFNARYYDATIGRFINVDPVQDGVNWYVYCNNNPLSFLDPTGLADESIEVIPDEWDPGKQWAAYYIGTEIHRNIAEYYKSMHRGETVYTNDTQINTILEDKNLCKQFWGGTLRPDIYNSKTNEIYEIKSSTYYILGEATVNLYKMILESGGLDVKLGDSSDPGTKGVVSAPGGFAVFASPSEGVIIYQYFKSEVNEPVKVPVILPDFILDRKTIKDIMGNAGVALTGASLAAIGSAILNTLDKSLGNAMFMLVPTSVLERLGYSNDPYGGT